MHDMGPEGRRLLLAHEMHHAFVERHWPAPEPADPSVERVFHALDQLRLEGTADLVDKPRFSEGAFLEAYRTAYHAAYDRSVDILSRFSSLLVQMDAEREHAGTHAEATWRTLCRRDTGHAPRARPPACAARTP
jgi:hypothetical protein